MAAFPATSEAPRFSEGRDCFVRPRSNLRFDYEGYRKGTDQRVSVVIEGFVGPTRKKYRVPLRMMAIEFDQQVFLIPEEQARRESCPKFKAQSGSMFVVHEATQPLLHVEGFTERIRNIPERLLSSVINILSPHEVVVQHKPVSCLQEGDLGYTTQQLLTFKTEEGDKKILFLSTLAFLKGYIRMGLASKCIQLANFLYRPDYIALRLRSGGAYAAFLKSGLVDISTVSPFIETWNASEEKRQMIKSLDENTVHPNVVDPVTGNSIAVYAEGVDRAYKPDPTHEIAYKADLQMKDMGLVASRGDAMLVGGKVLHRIRDSRRMRLVT